MQIGRIDNRNILCTHHGYSSSERINCINFVDSRVHVIERVFNDPLSVSQFINRGCSTYRANIDTLHKTGMHRG